MSSRLIDNKHIISVDLLYQYILLWVTIRSASAPVKGQYGVSVRSTGFIIQEALLKAPCLSFQII